MLLDSQQSSQPLTLAYESIPWLDKENVLQTDTIGWGKALCDPVFQEFLRQNLIISAQKKYGKVMYLFSKGLYGFCGIWRVFVSLQFQTRYSGHTLSRLAEIRHNKTKQSTFPTTRGKSPKTTVTFKVILVYFVPLKGSASRAICCYVM